MCCSGRNYNFKNSVASFATKFVKSDDYVYRVKVRPICSTHICEYVSTRLDYCNSVLAGAPRSVADKLQRVLNAAAFSQWYPQIRSWSVTSAARRPALAGRSRACAVQARHNSAPVSATQSPAVPD